MHRDNEVIREQSGRIEDARPLVAFLYLLLRDHVATGVVEDILKEVPGKSDKPNTFTNGWLAKYAQNIAEDLL